MSPPITSRLPDCPSRIRCRTTEPRSAISTSSSRSLIQMTGAGRPGHRRVGRSRSGATRSGALAPSAATTNTRLSASHRSSSWPAKAISLPSGENVGNAALPLPPVSRRGRPPRTGMVHTSLRNWRSSRRGCRSETNAIVAPSGEKAGSSWSYSPRVSCRAEPVATSTTNRWHRPSCQPTPSRRAARPRGTRGALRSWGPASLRSGAPTRQTTAIWLESGDQANWLTGPGSSPSRDGMPPSSGASRTWAMIRLVVADRHVGQPPAVRGPQRALVRRSFGESPRRRRAVDRRDPDRPAQPVGLLVDVDDGERDPATVRRQVGIARGSKPVGVVRSKAPFGHGEPLRPP